MMARRKGLLLIEEEVGWEGSLGFGNPGEEGGGRSMDGWMDGCYLKYVCMYVCTYLRTCSLSVQRKKEREREREKERQERV